MNWKLLWVQRLLRYCVLENLSWDNGKMNWKLLFGGSGFRYWIALRWMARKHLLLSRRSDKQSSASHSSANTASLRSV